MAAEASAGQADGKPEVKHEDDEHFRTEDSSCRGRGKHISGPRTAPAGGGETPDLFYTQATYETAIQAGAFRSGEGDE